MSSSKKVPFIEEGRPLIEVLEIEQCLVNYTDRSALLFWALLQVEPDVFVVERHDDLDEGALRGRFELLFASSEQTAQGSISRGC